MSKIYEHYRGIQADMKNTDLEDAKSHTSRIYRYLDEIPPLMPQKNTDGTLLNREIFIKRIKESQVLARELRGTLIEQNIEASQKVLGDMFQLCVSCHNSVLNKSKAKK